MTFISRRIAVPVENLGARTHAVYKAVLETTAILKGAVLLSLEHGFQDKVCLRFHSNHIQRIKQVRGVAHAAASIQELLKIEILLHFLARNWAKAYRDTKIEPSEPCFFQRTPISLQYLPTVIFFYQSIVDGEAARRIGVTIRRLTGAG